jgi:glycosyltransferase involved in cell wall biosynthesis
MRRTRVQPRASTSSAEAAPAVRRFTIVTPSYNHAPFIGETIASVLTQHGDFEIEYLVMDGGSTDGSVDIIRSYAERIASADWDVRCAGITMDWISGKDRGQSDAINQGIRRATGDIVAYLNSDDTYLPGALHAVATAFDSNVAADIIYGDGDVVDAQGKLQWEWRARPYDQALMTTYYFLWNSFTNFVMQQATFWRRRVQDRIGLFDESFHYAMDAEYWTRAAAAGLRLEHLPRKLATFRLIEGTKSLSSPTVFWEDFLELYRRYHGAAAMAPYFGFYYFNLARHRDFDADRALADGRAPFLRWTHLDRSERAVLEEQSQRGAALACVLIARDLLHAGRIDQAARTFRRGLTRPGPRIIYPAIALYLVDRVIGAAGRRWLDRWARGLVTWYKRGKYDCRYNAPGLE